MHYEDNPISIKHYVKRYILQHKGEFEDKVVVDVPAGTGITSRLLRDFGARVHPFDLFPEYFKTEGLTCERANLMKGLPLPDGFADVVFCQEGIEHFRDQCRAFEEFNRILKKDGTLFVTTPNCSNLQSKLSHLLFETEYHLKTMPMNELDSIWMADRDSNREIYLGHLFLLGIQKLRLLAKLSGFRIESIIYTTSSTTSLVLLPFLYPLLLLTNWWTYKNNVRRYDKIPGSHYETVYRELMWLNCDVRLLTGKHLFIKFIREADLATVRSTLRGRHRSFEIVT